MLGAAAMVAGLMVSLAIHSTRDKAQLEKEYCKRQSERTAQFELSFRGVRISCPDRPATFVETGN